MKNSILVTLSLSAGLALVGLARVRLADAAEVRIWTDSTGKHKTEAEFVSLDDDIVTLRKPGTDKTIKLPLERLSDADQEYVDDLIREQERTATQTETSAPRARTSVTRAEKPVPPSAPRHVRAATAPAARRPANNVINSVRGAVYRTQTMNNMKQISLGLVQYESAKGRFPTAAIMTPDGKPGLSWRVAILPMLEENGLYRQFKLDEPWDSDHNKALIARMPSIYQSPGSDLDAGYTNYLAVVAPDTVIAPGPKGVRMRDVSDGTLADRDVCRGGR